MSDDMKLLRKQLEHRLKEEVHGGVIDHEAMGWYCWWTYGCSI